MRPLYADLAERKIPWVAEGGHAGLWFDKFLHDWIGRGLLALPATRVQVDTDDFLNKRAAITEFTDHPVGDEPAIREAADRHRNLIEASGGSLLHARAVSRFLTGAGHPHPTEVGFTWHPTLGTPYLPGTGVKGATRAWAERWAGVDAKAVERIFGPRAGGALSVGSVIFFDALPVRRVHLAHDILTPHYPHWYREEEGAAPSDDQGPVPVPFLCVDRDARFVFGVAPRRRGDEQDATDALAAVGWLRDLLDHVGVGAKTSAGYGRFLPDDEERKAYERAMSLEREAAAQAAALARAKATLSPIAAELYEEARDRQWSAEDLDPGAWSRAQGDFLSGDRVEGWLARLAAEPDEAAVRQLAQLCRKFLRKGIFDIDPTNPPKDRRGRLEFSERQLKIVTACRALMAQVNLSVADLG